jgi:DNA-binding CsgD family transcriptional regulator
LKNTIKNNYHRDDAKPYRSTGYQWKLLEISYSHDKLDVFDSFHGKEKHDEQLLELKDQLLARLYEILPAKLTEHQWNVLQLLLKGHTQIEISKILGTNQSSIAHCINGNMHYYKGKRYETKSGGLFKKIKRIAHEDVVIQRILKEIQELH